ncbi:short-chain dehydrogenase/reductase SDR [Segniliparus rotundus DSM 44985]|uniref:Short-chain dehydrogenase/reductase SDR n=1 Tax=Segniliparus rotundus (strain ATCC BAA-972 / CDC 1076 / CIP 108378 / DSM 44985 / JCM 13578) TaxID=640132 RepID=D6ZB88_SEGRD|nr:SDR family NAD(P)-dependent oxidoreductase [Segniliparus rotundus]ADG96847.1 short-chain dehydrogenase/reductase SDR [Segniliparus rotundus DSM 44985]
MPLPPPAPGQPAVITGASDGIGKAIAFELAALGRPVLLVARRGELLEKTAEQIRARHGVDAQIRAVDLVDRDARRKFLDELAEMDVSVLVSNAGVVTAGLWHGRLDPALERAEVELNVVAAYEVVLAALPKMLERGSGGVVVTGSIAGNGPAPITTTYSATKAFLNTFAESLHFDVRGRGVNVTLLAPGVVHTGLLTGPLTRVPGFLCATAEQTAKAAVEGVARNKLRVAPIAAHKVQSALANYLPRPLWARAMYRFYGGK